MSTRSAANEILSLVSLVNAPGGGKPSRPITTDDVQQVITGIENGGTIDIPVDTERCLVIVSIEEFNADPATTNTMVQARSGQQLSIVDTAPWVLGSDLFYVYGPGTVELTFSGTATAGKHYFARVLGYYLPVSALGRLTRIATVLL